MKKLLAIMLASAFVFALFACESTTPTSLEDYLQMSTQSGKPVLVDFYTEW